MKFKISEIMAVERSELPANKRPLSVIKFLEFILAITCLVLDYYSFEDRDLVTAFLTAGTFGGYVVILTTILAGFLTKTPLHKRLDLFYSLLGCALFLISGVFIIENWERGFRNRTRDLAMAKALVAIINGVIFFLDAIFRFREK